MSLRDGQVLEYGDYEPESLAALVEKFGWILVAGVPCWVGNPALLDLAASFGTIRSLGLNLGDPVREGEAVHLINALPEPMPDASGKMMLSTMAIAHHLHTDESFFEVPSRYVLLHCWHADPAGGGDSLFSNIVAILDRLEPWAADACFRTNFEWRQVKAPILTPMPGRPWPKVRFNLREVLDSHPGNGGDERARLVADHFSQAAAAAAVRVPMAAGDCIILDNWRVLHGRTPFSPGSPRLLKRVGVD